MLVMIFYLSSKSSFWLNIQWVKFTAPPNKFSQWSLHVSMNSCKNPNILDTVAYLCGKKNQLATEYASSVYLSKDSSFWLSIQWVFNEFW